MLPGGRLSGGRRGRGMGEDGFGSKEEIGRFRRSIGFLQESGIPLKDGCNVRMIRAVCLFFKLQSSLILSGGLIIFFTVSVIRGQTV
jgi:hypothetical protein